MEISEQRLRDNFAVLTELAGPETAVLAVIKANAYGHGAERCALILAAAGAEWLGVTSVEEGAAVRAALSDAGVALDEQPRVLVMSGIAEEDAEAVVAEDLTPVVWLPEQVEWLRGVAEGAGRMVRVHVEVDSGMTRQGARPGAELLGVLEARVGKVNDLALLSDHLSLFKRWYYRPEKQRTGEVFLPNADGGWPVRRILRGAARAALGEPKKMAETQREAAKGAKTKILHEGRADVERAVVVAEKRPRE